MNFSEALEMAKTGALISRHGWNGNNMYVVLQKGYPGGIAINAQTASATRQEEGTICFFRPYLLLRTVNGSFVPWVASQADLLAEDWITL